jgi:hypothetical protein
MSTVPNSYSANELLNLAGAVEQAPYIKLIHATFDGELSARAQQMIVTALRALASPSLSGPSHKPWTHPMTVTETMLAAAKKAEPKVGREAILHIYRAMMAASPSATPQATEDK